MKAVIVAVIVVIAAWSVTSAVSDALQGAVDRAFERLEADVRLPNFRGGQEFWTKLERELDRAADPKNDLPADKKQKLLADLRIIVGRWRPFLEAVAAGENAGSPPSRAAK